MTVGEAIFMLQTLVANDPAKENWRLTYADYGYEDCGDRYGASEVDDIETGTETFNSFSARHNPAPYLRLS